MGFKNFKNDGCKIMKNNSIKIYWKPKIGVNKKIVIKIIKRS